MELIRIEDFQVGSRAVVKIVHVEKTIRDDLSVNVTPSVALEAPHTRESVRRMPENCFIVPRWTHQSHIIVD